VAKSKIQKKLKEFQTFSLSKKNSRLLEKAFQKILKH